jgi:dTDP-4-amino-4,6-dideoxygalactose transaminase
VFCDIDLETFCVTADTVKAALTPKTKAVVAVDLFGNVPPIGEIEALGVPVLEDAAQALGTATPAGRAGSLGTTATVSFFPSKNLGCFGDGGAILTSDAELDESVRMLRFHGSRDKVTFERVGYNSRLDELQAAVLRVQLPLLDEWAARRNAAGRAYEEEGLGEVVALPRPADGVNPAWHLYVVRSESADELAEALTAEGIGNRAYYRVPTHRQPALREFAGEADLPVTDEAARTNLAVPMSPALTVEQVRAVCQAARAVPIPLR